MTTRVLRVRDLIRDIGFVEAVSPGSTAKESPCSVCGRCHTINSPAPRSGEIWDVYSDILGMPISQLPLIVRALGSGVYLLKEFIPAYLARFPHATLVEPTWLRRNYPYRKRIERYVRILEEQSATLNRDKSQFAFIIRCRKCAMESYGFLPEEAQFHVPPDQEKFAVIQSPMTSAVFESKHITKSGLYRWEGTSLATPDFVDFLTMVTGNAPEPARYKALIVE